MSSLASRLALLGSGQGGALALRSLLGGNQGLFLDLLNDDALIVDGATPANNYRGKASSKLTFTRASSAWRFNSAGLLESVASDVMRIDYDPVARVARGLLMEVNRTNLCLWSRQLTSGNGWTTTASVAVDATGIDGVSSSATTLTATSTSDITYRGSITVTASTVYTLSFYAKAGTMTGPNCAVYNESGAAFIVTTQAYTPGAGEFTRVTCTFTTPVGCTAIRIYPLRLCSGVGTVIIDGVQLEAGAIPSSYIPTTSAQVTRAAEVCKIATTLFPAVATGPYTLFVKGIMPPTHASDGTRVPLSLSTNSFAESRYFSRTAAGGVYANNVTSSSANATVGNVTVSALAAIKFAARFDLNNTNAAVNGTLGTNDTVCALPSAPTQLNIGNLVDAGTSQWHGWIQQVAVIPAALTDAQLQAITS